jgi:hypothetical protein
MDIRKSKSITQKKFNNAKKDMCKYQLTLKLLVNNVISPSFALFVIPQILKNVFYANPNLN